MNIKSTLSLRALAAAGLISASAACAAQVWCALPQGDASRAAVPLKDIARLQLSDDGVTFSIVRTDGKSAASGLTKITFAKCEEGTTALRASAAPSARFSADGSRFELSGVAAGSAVTVFTLSGESVRVLRAGAQGTASADLSALPQGKYILRAGNSAFGLERK